MMLAFLLTTMLADSGFVETNLGIPTDGTRLALRDMDGDGGSDLVWITRVGVGVRFLRENGTYPQQDDCQMNWPAEHMAWDFADLDGNGAVEFVGLVDSTRIMAWGVGRENGFDKGRVVIESTKGSLPRGKRHIGFARDVNNDGKVDLVVPSAGRYLIYLNRLEAGSEWSKPLEVLFEPSIDYRVGNPELLNQAFGVSIQIPWFSLEDLDGDGLIDLVSETHDYVQFHIASPQLPSEPTWRLDKKALRADVEQEGSIDFKDLFAFIGGQVAWQMTDLDGEGAKDLIVQQGSTFRIYLGGSRLGNERRPDSLLKSGGRVLTFLLRDLDGDGLVELLMVRAEKISLGRVVRWLVLPGSLDFDIFSYKNMGGVFSRKPISKVALRLEIPRLLSFIDELEEVGEDISAGLDYPTTVGAFDHDGVFNDVVDIVKGEVVVFRDCAPADLGIDWRNVEELDVGGMVKSFLSDQIADLEDGGLATLDLGSLADIDFSPADELRTACEGLEPFMRHKLAIRPEKAALTVVDIDGDGVSDLVLYQDKANGKFRPVQILLTKE